MHRTSMLGLKAKLKTQTRRLAYLGKPHASPWRQLRRGDKLWVRENWRPDDYAITDISRTIFMADATDQQLFETRGAIKWRPSIHLPRVRSRYWLHLLADVTEESVQLISDADAYREGYPGKGNWERRSAAQYSDGCDAVHWYRDLWCMLHGKSSWEANPTVAVISFIAHEGNIDAT